MQTNQDPAEQKAKLSAAKRALLEKQLRGRLTAAAGSETITKRPVADPALLSFPQQRLWFLSRMDSANVAYNIPTALHLSGQLNIPLLTLTVNEIVRRHEILRTKFDLAGDQAIQIIRPELPIEIEVQDLSALPPQEQEPEVLRRAREDGAYRFDLQNGPLLRVNLLDLGKQEYVLLFTLHHIVFDGWSAAVLFEEFATLYLSFAENRLPALPPVPIQYADYAYWQRQQLQGERLEKLVAYWRRQLADVPALLELPTDRPRPPIQSGAGAVYSFRVDRLLAERLREISRKQGATLFVTLVSVFSVLLHRYSGQQDFCIGASVANRSRPEFEALIGLFANMLVLRAELAENPRFTDFLRRMRTVSLEAQEYQDLPFEKLVEELNPMRDRSYSPYFQVIFVMHNMPSGKWEVPGLQVRYLPIDFGSAKSDLTFHITEDNDGFDAAFEYSTDLFEKNTIERMATHFGTLLKTIAAQPETRVGDLPLLTEKEYRQLSDWSHGAALLSCDDGMLHERFEAVALAQPEQIAVICGDRQLSYCELNRRAEQWARLLRLQGIVPEMRVGLCAERSIEAIVGMIAILKAGGAYVPLDPSAPPERLDALLRDCAAGLLLTQAHLKARLRTEIPTLCLDDAEAVELRVSGDDRSCPPYRPVSAQQAAYLIYTSGSTGKPKAVLVSHANAAASTAARLREYGEQPEGFMLLSSFAFDSSVAGIFWTLSHGGRLCIAQEGKHQEPNSLAAAIERDRPSHLLCLPSLYGLLLESCKADQTNSLRCVIVAGETCPTTLIKQHYQRLPGTILYNEYGPTEATVWCSVYKTHPQDGNIDRAVSIGAPIAGYQLYILDPQMNFAPVGVPGEVYIGGAGVARGYLQRPGLTAEKFVPNPYEEYGARLYRSGDLARRHADGMIEFLGRVDNQVKIRGFRIEPGEIEMRLLRHPLVKETAVLVREDRPGDKRIAAYIVPAGQTPAGSNISASETLRAYLKETLPDYMIPASFVILEQLPLMTNGKLDRNALPVPIIEGRFSGSGAVPLNPVEEAVAAIWKEILGAGHIDIHDNFFDLGGHSLSAIQVIVRIQDRFGIEISVAELFDAPTIYTLSQILMQQQSEPADEEMLALLAELEQLPDGEAQRLLNDLAI
ncbi:non-ribosomal peptide synthetase [Candidatus Methylospira mobilis]|nr:non-ribosomal peptide synthetase [Candidatus Methylospira mobilis]